MLEGWPPAAAPFRSPEGLGALQADAGAVTEDLGFVLGGVELLHPLLGEEVRRPVGAGNGPHDPAVGELRDQIPADGAAGSGPGPVGQGRQGEHVPFPEARPW